jgi:formate dehydrogenase major subunit
MDEIARLTPTFHGVSYAGSTSWAASSGRATKRAGRHAHHARRRHSCAARVASCSPSTCRPPKSAPEALPADTDHRPHPQPVQRGRTDAAHRQFDVARRGPAGDPSGRRRRRAASTKATGWASPAAPARRCCALRVSERMQPGVVYTTFHFPESGANVITTDNSDWATNCPEYKVTAVQVSGRSSQPLLGAAHAWRPADPGRHPGRRGKAVAAGVSGRGGPAAPALTRADHPGADHPGATRPGRSGLVRHTAPALYLRAGPP